MTGGSSSSCGDTPVSYCACCCSCYEDTNQSGAEKEKSHLLIHIECDKAISSLATCKIALGSISGTGGKAYLPVFEKVFEGRRHGRGVAAAYEIDKIVDLQKGIRSLYGVVARRLEMGGDLISASRGALFE